MDPRVLNAGNYPRSPDNDNDDWSWGGKDD